MLIRIGMEENFEERCLAWGLDFPGCFSYGADAAEALLRFPHALLAHADWVNENTDFPWFEIGDMDLRTEERFRDYTQSVEGKDYEVNATFKDDERLLTPEDVEQALLVYCWQREELLAGVETLASETLTRKFSGERWDILGILRHLARAEYWCLQNLDLPLLALVDAPQDPVSMLSAVEIETRKHLAAFAGNPAQTLKKGEQWTCRKVVRRVLWHQRDHINHIKKLAFRPL